MHQTDPEKPTTGVAGQIVTSLERFVSIPHLLAVTNQMDALKGTSEILRGKTRAIRLSYEIRICVRLSSNSLAMSTRVLVRPNTVHARAGTRVLTSRMLFW